MYNVNMKKYSRSLDLSKKIKTKSYFLFGPRATGKSYLIKHFLKDFQLIDLLETNVFNRLVRNPSDIEHEIKKSFVVIDEVQKIPALLNEVHRLIENKDIKFLLTGSSARKLRRGGANLLAGRARWVEIFPLTSHEIDDFDLLKYCQNGGLPAIYNSDDAWLDLKNYVQLYLKEEIMSEAIVRRIDHYSRFIDVIGQRSGEELNYDRIASDSEVPAKTVANYVEILKDTLLSYELLPYKKLKKYKSVSKSKIYLFDVGVANYLAGRKKLEFKSEAFGKSFEHFIINEIRAYLNYTNLDYPMQYWRTVGTQYEVDCIVGDEIAIEIKSTDKFNDRLLKNISIFKSESNVKKYYVISC